MRENEWVTAANHVDASEEPLWSTALEGKHLVAVSGDWHHNTDWAVATINQVARRNVTVLLHVGDFGLWPGETAFLGAVDDALLANNMTLLVTPGNHEDWAVLDDAFAKNHDQPFRPDSCERVWILPRGFRFQIAHSSFLSIGGAPSVDRDERQGENIDWWPTEIISDSVVDEIISHGPVDIMLSHDAPKGSAEKVEEIAERRLREHPQWRDYIQRGRHQLNRIYESLQPKLLIHGHYHLAGVAEHANNRVIALNRDGQLHTTVLLDLAGPELRATFLD